MSGIPTARDILARYNQSILDKSADDLAALYADEAVHELPFSHSESATMRGREAIRTRYAEAWAVTPIKVNAIDNIVIHDTRAEGTIVVEESLALTNTETGADFVAATVLVIRTADGGISQMRDYTDNLTIATALGRIPAVA